MTYEIVKGFEDVSGEEALKREILKEIIAKNFRLFGFEPAETPCIEFENFVKGDNSNDEAVSDIYKLEDKGKRKLALRYEFTFQLKRIAQNKKLPYKRYQIGPVFRDEPVSSNRFRQFTQCDVDVVGSTFKEEAEVLALACKILKEVGIKATVYINNRKLLNEILDVSGIKEKEKVIKEIDKLDKLSESEVRQNLKKLKADKVLEIFKKPEKYFEKYNSYKEILELKKYCSFYDLNVKFSPTLARGLSYYNGNVFEIKGEMKESIFGGGSYLVNNVQATGISFGLERISALAKLKVERKDVVIISIAQDEKSIQLATQLREKNIPSEILYKISKGLEYANSLSIPFVIFIGEEEVKKKKFKLRNMKSGKEEFLSDKEIIERLR